MTLGIEKHVFYVCCVFFLHVLVAWFNVFCCVLMCFFAFYYCVLIMILCLYVTIMTFGIWSHGTFFKNGFFIYFEMCLKCVCVCGGNCGCVRDVEPWNC